MIYSKDADLPKHDKPLASMTLAPIVLFVYNRPEHTAMTVESLLKNDLAAESSIYIYSDGPKNNKEVRVVEKVREYIRKAEGFKEKHIVERERNLGLAQSVISGVSDVINNHGRVIVLEDDLVSSPYFLRYMNEALELYMDEERVISIHGYNYPVRAKLPDTFFLKGADCWGWATWKRGWDLFEPDGQKLLHELRTRNLAYEFDFNGAYGYTEMLQDQIKGKNNSWAIRWYASAFLKGKLTLYPGKSLICNIGLDGSGVHCGASKAYDIDISRAGTAFVEKIPIEEDAAARKEIEKYLRSAKRFSLSDIVRPVIHNLFRPGKNG
jgi:hypothetical protein